MIIKKNYLFFFKFILCGFFSTLLNLLFLFFLTKIFEETVILLIFYWIFAISLKFFLHKIYVFDEDFYLDLKNKIKKYFLFYFALFIINYFFLEVFKIYSDYNQVLAQTIFLVIFGPISFVVMRIKIFN